MPLTVAVQMDPIARIRIAGDSTFALLLEAQARGHRMLHYTPDRLRLSGSRVETKIPFRLLSGGQEEAFDLVDLSEAGVRIRCRRSLGAMTRIQVAMVLPGKRIGASSDVQLWSSTDLAVQFLLSRIPHR